LAAVFFLVVVFFFLGAAFCNEKLEEMEKKMESKGLEDCAIGAAHMYRYGQPASHRTPLTFLVVFFLGAAFFLVAAFFLGAVFCKCIRFGKTIVLLIRIVQWQASPLNRIIQTMPSLLRYLNLPSSWGQPSSSWERPSSSWEQPFSWAWKRQ